MIVLAGILFGAIFGGLRARKRKGRPADIAQYAVVYAVAFGLLALFVSLFLDRMVF